MTTVLNWLRVVHKRLVAFVLALFVGASMIASAEAAETFKTTGGLAIYLGVLPAEIAKGHSPDPSEGKMHGGTLKGRTQHHVMVAIFEARSGARVTDAEVTARVAEIGLGQTERRLESMTMDKAISYGNYFSMGSPGPYRIDLEIKRPAWQPVRTIFEYSHPRR